MTRKKKSVKKQQVQSPPDAPAQEALTISKVLYRRLFEAARDGILILDAESGMVVDVNPFLVEMLDYSREQFLGKAIWELGFFKDIVANKAHFAELQQKEFIQYEDIPLETVKGRLINVEFVSHVYRVDHHKVIQCNIRDITQRKRLENILSESKELYKGVFRTASDGILLLEKREGKIIHIIPAVEKMLGYTKKECIGNKLQDIGFMFDMDDLQTTMQNLNENSIINYTNVPLTTKSGQHYDGAKYNSDNNNQ